MLSRNRVRALLAVVIIGLILPTFYIAVSSLTGRALTITAPREYRYSDAVVTVPSTAQAQAILASLAQNINPEDLNRLRNKLLGVSQFSIPKEDPLGDYIKTMSNFSRSMTEIDFELQTTRASIASGNMKVAAADVSQLVRSRDKAKQFLSSLYQLLDRIGTEYGVDTTTQLQKIKGLDQLFQSYSAQVVQISSKLRTQQGFVETVLTLNASRPEPLINETFSVYGFLKIRNGSAIVGRNITISWDSRQTVLKSTDFEGRFEANVSLPVGFVAGPTKIEANYEPEGNDSKVYLPSTAFVEVSIAYQPSRIAAEISPMNVKPSDHADVKGNLSAVEGRPLKFKTIVIQMDGTSLGNTTTNNAGTFIFRLYVPLTLSNGTHNVTVTFPAVRELFAPSNITLPLVVETVPTQLLMSVDRTWLFSGMRLAVNGTITHANSTAPTGGNVTIYFDDQPYANATVKDDGTFLSAIQLPVWLYFGTHSLRTEYVPDRPWVQNSRALVQVFIYNTPLIIIAGVAVPTVSSLGIYLIRRKRRAAVATPITMPQPIALETPPKEEFSRESLISAIKTESLHAAKIRKSYNLAQAIISQKIGESPRNGETHWEYYSRVAMSRPKIADTLKRLVELFELAEYSPYPVESAQSREATEILLELREEIETVK